VKKERLAFLFDKYVADSIDASELAELEHYMGTTDDEYLRDLIAIKMQGSAASEEQIDIESIIVQLEKNVWSRINPPVQKLWLRIMKVAAILLACLMPLMIFKIQQDSERKFHVIPASNVLGGSKQAILTLDDGTKIGLAESGAGMIAEQHGIKILKTADGQIHYEIASLPSGDGKAQGERYHLISTPKGGECMVHLSDGSKVWLNAASSLRYAAEVSRSGQRLVKLTGEAYFEVASDASRPFIVQTDRQRIGDGHHHFVGGVC
jgi:transmembrane sensor